MRGQMATGVCWSKPQSFVKILSDYKLKGCCTDSLLGSVLILGAIVVALVFIILIKDVLLDGLKVVLRVLFPVVHYVVGGGLGLV